MVLSLKVPKWTTTGNPPDCGKTAAVGSLMLVGLDKTVEYHHGAYTWICIFNTDSCYAIYKVC